MGFGVGIRAFGAAARRGAGDWLHRRFCARGRSRKALETLVPGTDEYYYFHALHYQNLEQYEQVEAFMEPWLERVGATDRYHQIRRRQALLQYAVNPQRTLDFLKSELNLTFSHQRELPEAELKLPTALDGQLIDPQRLLRAALAEHTNTDGIEDRGLERLAAMELDEVPLRHLMQRLRRPDYPQLTALIVREQKLRNAPGFGSYEIHRHLTLAQLEALTESLPKLLNDQNFVAIYLSKLGPSDDVQWPGTPGQQLAYLERLAAFADRLDAVHNSLKASILYRRLELDRRMGVYDRQRFLAYLAIPRSVGYINPRMMERITRADHVANLSADYSGAARLPVVADDEPLVRDYLHHFLADAADSDAFASWIESEYLRRRFAEAKITQGLGDREQWAAWLSPAEYQELLKRVDLDFDWTSKNRFAVDERVELKLWVKNVENLIVKVFEINTENFYRGQSREIDSDIPLDGLVPHFEESFHYDDPPQLRQLRTFNFPQIDHRGVYVIDFIGNGKSSRALVRKGHLYPIAETTLAGQRLQVLDEADEPVGDARVWMAGHEYTADEDGKITLPFSTQPGPQTIVISRSGFSSLAVIQHEAESYQLQAGIYVDRQSLLRNQRAVAVLRGGLSLNGTPVPLQLLKKVRLTVLATDLDGMVTTSEYRDLALREVGETEQAFQVPPRLRQLDFVLSAEVERMTNSEPQRVQTTASFQINEIDATPSIRDAHLLALPDGYVIEVLGKTGETRVRQAVALSLKHADFRRPVEVTLQTDERGRVVLGPLDGIATVSATLAGTATRTWVLPRPQQNWPVSVHAGEGEPIRIPLDAPPGDGLTFLSLLEFRGPTFVADRTAAVSRVEGGVEIKNLPPGDYLLRIKPQEREIRLRITAGRSTGSYVGGPDRFLERRRRPDPRGRCEVRGSGGDRTTGWRRSIHARARLRGPADLRLRRLVDTGACRRPRTVVGAARLPRIRVCHRPRYRRRIPLHPRPPADRAFPRQHARPTVAAAEPLVARRDHQRDSGSGSRHRIRSGGRRRFRRASSRIDAERRRAGRLRRPVEPRFPRPAGDRARGTRSGRAWGGAHPCAMRSKVSIICKSCSSIRSPLSRAMSCCPNRPPRRATCASPRDSIPRNISRSRRKSRSSPEKPRWRWRTSLPRSSARTTTWTTSSSCSPR